MGEERDSGEDIADSGSGWELWEDEVDHESQEDNEFDRDHAEERDGGEASVKN